jgi:hypothetical protein
MFELDDSRGDGILGGKLLERVVQREQLVIARGSWRIGEMDAVERPAMFEAILAPRVLDKNAAHRFGGRREEMPAMSKSLIADQSQICFMNEGSGVKRLAGLFLSKLRGRKFAQLVVNQREELGGGAGIAGGGRI